MIYVIARGKESASSEPITNNNGAKAAPNKLTATSAITMMIKINKLIKTANQVINPIGHNRTVRAPILI